MSDLNGNCLCGAVSITLQEVKAEVSVCHCDMCRRWGGSAFMGVSGGAFRVKGEDHVTVYTSSDWAERAFCKACGSNLYYRYVPGDHYSFQAGLFSDADALSMSEQIFIDEKPDYYSFADDTPKLTGAEVKAKYGVG
ncbi:GFA family protein [Pacificimonas sp. WHA3]|uniref:GFA family protein n=1 Tax=Pacificimonas pallii TaxID=2827236 RepID=A0ABS6SIJ8_9SPHN|nr:GFA family protein [Pacificimonas pallii]MBV7257883.1 GFA family protein [Pacificimonas pallii]